MSISDTAKENHEKGRITHSKTRDHGSQGTPGRKIKSPDKKQLYPLSGSDFQNVCPMNI